MEKCELIYKDVVVIGNGPSGITLSYMLHGNWPYYNGQKLADEFLEARLKIEEEKSLVEQDLSFLSQGLVGRSNNPIAVLYDALNHPSADIGAEESSALRWQRNEDKCIDHVVIGRGKPGGAWHHLGGTTLTISLGSWMELPNYSFEEWEAETHRQDDIPISRQNRATAASVAQYYADYVKHESLAPSFLSNMEVLRVRNICSDRSKMAELKRRFHFEHSGSLWEVTVHDLTNDKLLVFATPHVVLATGSADIPNLLSIPGEKLPFVLHSYSEFESLLETNTLTRDSDPLLIIGAGLTAADAVMTAYFHNIPTMHAFRRDVNDSKLIFRTLPTNLYPEYYKVFQMMQDGGQSYNGYQSYPAHNICEIKEDKTVIIEDSRGKCLTTRVSYVIVLIGSRPDLSFLPPEWSLGRLSEESIQCKSNPVNIDPYSMESTSYPGIFALGPLAGDNFVRFLQGGALAVVSHLNRRDKS